MVELPSVEAQKEFYENQREDMLKVNLQNEFTRLRNEKRVSESTDEDEVALSKAELKKIQKQFDVVAQTIEIIDEQLEKL
jgi:hypothetical protein